MAEPIIAKLAHVELQYAYQDPNDVSPYTYATYEQAIAACEKRAKENDPSDPYKHLLWYCVEERIYRPCSGDTGQLYIGVNRHTFVEVSKREDATA